MAKLQGKGTSDIRQMIIADTILHWPRGVTICEEVVFAEGWSKNWEVLLPMGLPRLVSFNFIG